MGSLGMLNIAAPPPPKKKKNYFWDCSRSTKKGFLYGRSFCLRPIVRNTGYFLQLCQTPNSLSWLFPGRQKTVFMRESGDIAMGLLVFPSLYNG